MNIIKNKKNIFLISMIIFLLYIFHLKYFNNNYFNQINTTNKLKHIGIIMDGNRRWAKLNKKTQEIGYKIGADTAINLIDTFIEENIEEVTLYALSKDNFEKRTKEELNIIFNIAFNTFENKKDWLIQKGISLNVIGQIQRLNNDQQKKINDLIDATKNGKILKINILFVYDYLDEIVDLVNNVNIDYKNKKINLNDLNNYFHKKNIHPVDYLIRTGNVNRISGFIPIQIGYAEIKFLDIYWPEMNSNILKKCIKEYRSIQRNFGK